MKKFSKLSLIACLCVAGLSTANAGEFKIGTDVSKVEMEGKFNYLGTDINTKDTLGMDKKDTVVVPTISYTSGNHTVFGSYTGTKFEGSKTLTTNVDFNGTTYAAATDVNSAIETKWGVLGYRYNVGDLGTNKFLNVKVGTDLHIIDLQAEIASATQGDKYDVTFAMPALALGVDMNIYKNVGVYGELAGMSFGSYGSYVEYDTGVKVDYSLVKGLEIKVGYKAREFDLEADADEKFNLEFKGAYAGLAYKF